MVKMTLGRLIVGFMTALCLLLFVLVLYITRAQRMNNCIFDNQVEFPAEAAVIQYTKVDAQRMSTGAQSCPTCRVYDLTSPVTVAMKCIYMCFSPPAPVCLHPVETDTYVSRSLQNTGKWEPDMVEQFQRWLVQSPGSGVIDVGANIGVYSLVAAALDRRVVAVEPNIANIQRLHSAVRLGRFEDRIILLQNAISDSRGQAELVYSAHNQGDTRIHPDTPGYTHANIHNDTQTFWSEVSKKQASADKYTRTIVIDDLVSFCDFTQAIMKIDVQGFEHRAFLHAERLFDQVHVSKVLMEWHMMRRRLDAQHRDLVAKMIRFFTSRGYEPRGWTGDRLNTERWHAWPWDVVWHSTRD